MATARRVFLTPQTKGFFSVPSLTEESAKKATEVLQKNHDQHHIYFNERGFHDAKPVQDHITHHILANYALGASPTELQNAYDGNTSYQRPRDPADKETVLSLENAAEFKKYLGKGAHYSDYLEFFTKEIEQKGHKATIKEYLLKGDEQANDMLGRLYESIYHPLIHLGYGVEFEQPAIIAEALAMTAVHERVVSDYLHLSEEASKTQGQPDKSLFDIFDEVRMNAKIRSAVAKGDMSGVYERLLKDCKDELVGYGAQYKVRPSDVAMRTAEMINLGTYYTIAAQRADKQIKIDFFAMHAVTSSISCCVFAAQDWLSREEVARLLEYKARFDLFDYLMPGAPDLHMEEVHQYQPQKPDQASWESLFARLCAFVDDGHAIKTLRALANGHAVSAPLENEGLGKRFRFRGSDWLQAANMVVDGMVFTTEIPSPNWVRGGGFDKAWDVVPARH